MMAGIGVSSSRQTRRELFLERIDSLVPWEEREEAEKGKGKGEPSRR